jgi:glycosyltransferase involved in cell wall biosynthesis
MKALLSVAIPAHNEELYIERCIQSIEASAGSIKQPVEIVVALNRCTDRTREIAESLGATCVVEDRRSIGAVRNAAVRASTSPAVATLDADSWMQQGTVAEILQRVYDDQFIGGGALVLPERWSLGIAFSLLAIAPYVIRRNISTGMFWFRREAFDQIGGFNEELASVEDLDFALRLRALGAGKGKKYGTIRRSGIRTSCRKFDTFGDWYLFLNPGLVRKIFTGTDRAAADLFYYDTKR